MLVESDALLCSRCEARYPYIAGLPIVVCDPASLLRTALDRVRAELATARDRLALVESTVSTRALSESLTRLRLVYSTLAANSSTFDDLMLPVAQWISRVALGTEGGAAVVRGWDVGALLPYLLRDWKCSRELDEAAHFVSARMDRHLLPSSRGTLVMLGCGAGGLTQRLARGFARVLGVELSVPMLLALRNLQLGRPLQLEFPVSGEHGAVRSTVLLEADEGALDNITFVVADACNTPLAAGSVDCVVTSFLLDVVDDPRAVAREVYRILADSGLWINYGPSSGLTAVWRFDEHEVATFMAALGFSVLETGSHRTTHLDLREIDESIHYQSHTCYVAAARKSNVWA